MTKSERMKPVSRVAESREREAARLLGQSQKILQEMETKLRELEAYRAEYMTRLKQQGGHGMAGREVLDYQAFLSKLNTAIAYQEQRVQQCRRECEHRRQIWQHSRTKTQILDKVVERYRQEEDRQSLAREQRELDERAQRAGKPREPDDSQS